MIKMMIQQSYQVKITYRRAWTAKQKAIVFGNCEGAYADLPGFLLADQRRNFCTVVEWSTVSRLDGIVNMFQCVFWSYGPCILGFEHFRSLIIIDDTHLYEKYKGCLLIAMGVDANEQIYPLDFSIVESENGSCWPLFMDILGCKITQCTGLCVISDIHAGILKAMRDLECWKEPIVFHRICVRHLFSNFHVRVKDKMLKDLLGSTAYVYEVGEFERIMNDIDLNNPLTRAWLEDAIRDKWSPSHDSGHRYSLMTTNKSECFNGVLKNCRSLPILGLVEATWSKLNSYFVNHVAIACVRRQEGYIFSEAIENKIEKYEDISEGTSDRL